MIIHKMDLLSGLSLSLRERPCASYSNMLRKIRRSINYSDLRNFFAEDGHLPRNANSFLSADDSSRGSMMAHILSCSGGGFKF